MVMGVLESQSRHGLFPELEGARVLITGLTPGHGVDVARAFADVGCRLILQAPEVTPELEVLLEIIAERAAEVSLVGEPVQDTVSAMTFAQGAAMAYGGLEAVVNLARLDARHLTADASDAEIEACVVDALRAPVHITQVVANRMRLTWTEGLILNIVTQAAPLTPVAAVAGQMARAGLANMTRREAQGWASEAVRINAIAPAEDTGCRPGSMPVGLESEPQIASLALHLASRRGRALSGLVFDAALA
jgi:3-oxoacyl-[acyl-carrier protein] reductase